ncbi:Myb-like DNA-binding domain containing protein [Tritrichomonas foetus]|uniref:Myb-like DNA-binding domain containing protein n=1 Tax=Tritrichomonas foetus TaxID=1144522 RepID=A0A1J4KLQ8_9EUKA|nr:Myb-like DNA-binding domain containing protein [Tritrichomonas foetus]|eukprot:OHT11872.1 Myb-like DNA-binding domain containing protein [Tritrichomonas foetus]
MELSSSLALAPTRSRNQTQSIIWTPLEDQKLTQIMKQTPSPPWCSLVACFPGKTAQQIAGRWGKVLNPHLVKGSWTREEDEMIINFVKQNGPKNWVKLASMLPGRIGKQCRERWTNHLSPTVAKVHWTEEEDQKLIELHRQFGNQWTMIASFFEGRTDNCVKNRWNSSLKRRIERIARGEPAMRKRGRKPKSKSSDSSSECFSPAQNELLTNAVSTLNVISNGFVMAMPPFVEKREMPVKSLAQNRLDLQLLMNRPI